MTEPTAEQVDREVDQAHGIVVEDTDDICGIEYGYPAREHGHLCRCIATALARVRIEALAAGRDGGLKLAEALCHSQDCGMGDEHCGCAFALTERIRALRGRS